VSAGEILFTIEAMKMINVVRAEVPAVIVDVAVVPGQRVAVDEVLVNFSKI
jgi:biotin carboxyl carrier protein